MHLHISIEDLLRSVDPLLAENRTSCPSISAMSWFRFPTHSGTKRPVVLDTRLADQ